MRRRALLNGPRGSRPAMRAATAIGVVLIVVGLGVAAYRAMGLGGSLTAYAIRVGSEAMGRAGLVGLMGLMAAESAAIPIPSEVVVPLAGAYYGTVPGLVGVVLASTLGNLVGSTVLYYVGLLGGRSAVYRYASLVGVRRESLHSVEGLFASRGVSIVLVGRVTPALRSYISLPAGVFRMDRLRFIAATAVGSLPWNAALAYMGHVLGAVAAELPWIDYVAASLAIALGLAVLLRG